MEYHDYGFSNPHATHMHQHFMPHVLSLSGNVGPGSRVLDIGCGNGYTAGQFLKLGCSVVGIDIGTQGIDIARKTYPQARFELLSAHSDILTRLNEPPFDLVISTEVIEHVYAPRELTKGAWSALKPGGTFVCTTPYHGYLKNLVLSLCNKWDTHIDPLWDGGHIKFWSRSTLQKLLLETGFVDLRFKGVGRVPFLWMTMAVAGTRPPLIS